MATRAGRRMAARTGFVNYAVPASKLKDHVMALAKEIASKDPVALECAKEAYRHSLGMTLDAAWSDTSAKESEVILAQNDSWRTEGIGDFLAGKYRPGLGGHEQVKR